MVDDPRDSASSTYCGVLALIYSIPYSLWSIAWNLNFFLFFYYYLLALLLISPGHFLHYFEKRRTFHLQALQHHG